MKVTREKAEENRERVIDTAATLLREKGIDGIGVADLMKAAGLTHGAFYRQFKSKDDLVVHAVERAFSTSRERLEEHMANVEGNAFEAFIRYYVSLDHRDAVGAGCSIVALAGDAARRDDPALHAVFDRAVERYLAALMALIPKQAPGSNRGAAMSILAEMVGAVILARVVANPVLSAEAIDTVATDLTARFAIP